MHVYLYSAIDLKVVMYLERERLSLLLQTRTHVLEIKHRHEDLRGRIMIYYRLARSK